MKKIIHVSVRIPVDFYLEDGSYSFDSQDVSEKIGEVLAKKFHKQTQKGEQSEKNNHRKAGPKSPSKTKR